MTASPPVEDFDAAWIEFVSGVGRLLLQTPMSERKAATFAHFRPWGESLLALLARRSAEFQEAWRKLYDDDATRDAAEHILMELLAFNSYIEASGRPIDRSTPEQRERGEGRFVSTDAGEDAKEGLGIAKTIVDSIKEMFDDLPPTWKILLKSMGELLEIGKGFFE